MSSSPHFYSLSRAMPYMCFVVYQPTLLSLIFFGEVERELMRSVMASSQGYYQDWKGRAAVWGTAVTAILQNRSGTTVTRHWIFQFAMLTLEPSTYFTVTATAFNISSTSAPGTWPFSHCHCQKSPLLSSPENRFWMALAFLHCPFSKKSLMWEWWCQLVEPRSHMPVL